MRRMHRYCVRFLVCVGLLVAWLSLVVNPVVFNYAAAALDAIAVQAVNNGVTEVVRADIYSRLTDIRRDENGAITSINADAVTMNMLATQVSSCAQKYLTEQGQKGLPIPLGTFSGVPLLVGHGAPINLKLQLIGAVNCNFESEFKTAGINQTEHKITLRTYAVVDIVLPLYTKRANVMIEMLFADSIIVGSVPEFLFTHTMN